jgi:hypothetical protein
MKTLEVHLMPRWLMTGLVVLALALVGTAPAQAQQAKKPNILILWGDDIGYWNVSAYNQGMMGYRTPNIDRIAKEGGLFTDWYGQQSCTAGRAAFNLRSDPFEQADHIGIGYARWRIGRL